jgi:hypothetical protein
MGKLTKAILLSLLLLSRLVSAQNAPAALEQDPVFNQTIVQWIHYPAEPASRAVYGRFYAGFSIDETGHIRDVSVLYPKMSTQMSKNYRFDYEIEAGLKHMPPLSPALAGKYILPIAFCFTHYREGPNPIVPTNVLPRSYDNKERILLSEVKVFAFSPGTLQGINAMPASKQVK